MYVACFKHINNKKYIGFARVSEIDIKSAEANSDEGCVYFQTFNELIDYYKNNMMPTIFFSYMLRSYEESIITDIYNQYKDLL